MNQKECDALDVSFSRILLAQVHSDVKSFRPSINLKKDAWVYKTMRDSWEFHGPEKFYWYGSACNAYEARYKGWVSWLRKVGANGYAE